MANENEIMQAAKQICEEKNISLDSVIQTIEAALAVAYRKDFGDKNQNIQVEFDLKTANARVFDVKTVVADEKAEMTEKLKEEALKKKESSSAKVTDDKEEKKDKEEDKKVSASTSPSDKSIEGKKVSSDKSDDTERIERFNPKTEITLSEAKKIRKGAKLGDVIRTELFPPAAYGRMAAQTAKQVIIQRLREAERDTIYKEFKDKEGEVINGTIQRLEGKMVLVDLGQTTALLPPSEQIPTERYLSGQRLKFFVVAVNLTPKGPEIILSRSYPEMVRKLFALEVPEIGNGSVEIRSVAREAGSRTKIAVTTNQKNIDPVGSCVGQRGSRVQTIISEIGGEKIDIIEWNEDPVKFIINALSPAKVLSVRINEEEKTALAEVKEDQLSLAIGKAGQNVRLSAKLTGWKIDIISDKGEKITSEAEKRDEKTEDKEGKNEETTKERKKKDVPSQKKESSSAKVTDDKEEKKDKEEDKKVSASTSPSDKSIEGKKVSSDKSDDKKEERSVDKKEPTRPSKKTKQGDKNEVKLVSEEKEPESLKEDQAKDKKDKE